MSQSTAAAQPPPARPQGVIASLVTLPLRLFGVLCGSLLLSILIEWAGMHFLWPQQSWHHAERMLEYELDKLSDYFTRSAVLDEPGRTAEQLVERTYERLFIRTGLRDWARETAAQVRTDATHARRLKRFIGLAYVHVETYALAAGYVLLTFLVRLLVLCLALPLFFLAAFVGVIDGLVRRDIRRFGAGRESGFIYHRARAFIVPLAVLPWIVYLALPISVHPILILLPSAVLLSIAVNIAAGSFKKYL